MTAQNYPKLESGESMLPAPNFIQGAAVDAALTPPGDCSTPKAQAYTLRVSTDIGGTKSSAGAQGLSNRQ